jgi:hypothetical protein
METKCKTNLNLEQEGYSGSVGIMVSTFAEKKHFYGDYSYAYSMQLFSHTLSGSLRACSVEL